ncbi:MAG: ABC transporter ATP-binding protein [Lachnospiraceae bacterium]|nr:ABC transporter ATP-binding protein [Lachnospiraceae bacterium]
MKEPIISFKDYSYQYRAQAAPTIMDINLEIYKGERVIIVGPSGCGKSTLAHCLNGLNPFSYPGESKGSLTICGMEAATSGIFQLSRFVGTVLQDTDGQFIGMTVLEDIAFSMENDCIPQEELITKTHAEAQRVGLLHKLQDAPHALSGGQKQRVSMAGVMVNQVPVLLFDEPLANLDPAAGRDAMELIDKLQKDGDKTVIIIEHRLEDAMYFGADRIIMMENGKIINDSTPEELFLSDKLVKAGIREPLYLTALKYAKVPLTADLKLENWKSLTLSEAEKQKIRDWFFEQKEKEAPPLKNEVLKVENLHFGYTPEVENLSDISFTVREGDMISIVGKNGAGKSTMAKLLCGFEKPGKGSMYLYGRDMAEDTIKERASSIGYVMQNPNQMISKPMIFDEVALSLVMQKLPEEEIKERVHETLKICGLYEFRNWPVSALSYGQKKRVTIASILVSRPKIIILDEPTAGQDFRHYTEIMEFLKELNEKGYTVLMITHDMHLMLEYTTRSIVFSEGKKIADTTPQKLFADAALLEQASLKETSLYHLADMCGIDKEAYIRAFIEYDREVRR